MISCCLFLQVCPALGPLLIRRVLNIFVPDEFCCDSIPEAVFEVLSEVNLCLIHFLSLSFSFIWKIFCCLFPLLEVEAKVAAGV